MNEQDKTAIIGAIELEIDGYLDGAPDANEASKLANRISLLIHNGYPLPYALPKGSMTPLTLAHENLGREVLKNGQLTCDVRYWRDIARRLAENGGGLKRYDSLEYADAIEEYKRSAAIYEAQEIANQELAQERGEEAADATETANRGRAV